MKQVAPVVAVVAAVLLLAACGGGSENTPADEWPIIIPDHTARAYAPLSIPIELDNGNKLIAQANLLQQYDTDGILVSEVDLLPGHNVSTQSVSRLFECPTGEIFLDLLGWEVLLLDRQGNQVWRMDTRLYSVFPVPGGLLFYEIDRGGVPQRLAYLKSAGEIVWSVEDDWLSISPACVYADEVYVVVRNELRRYNLDGDMVSAWDIGYHFSVRGIGPQTVTLGGGTMAGRWDKSGHQLWFLMPTDYAPYYSESITWEDGWFVFPSTRVPTTDGIQLLDSNSNFLDITEGIRTLNLTPLGQNRFIAEYIEDGRLYVAGYSAPDLNELWRHKLTTSTDLFEITEGQLVRWYPRSQAPEVRNGKVYFQDGGYMYVWDADGRLVEQYESTLFKEKFVPEHQYPVDEYCD